MATQRTSFAKMQRERDKKAKAAAKRERRTERDTADVEATEVDIPEGEQLSPADLLRLVEATHADYDAGRIDLDTFTERRAELLARLPVD